MSSPPRSAHFPAGSWWRAKLRALGEYLRSTESRGGGAKNGANENGTANRTHDTGKDKP